MRILVLLIVVILGMSSVFVYLSVVRPTPSEAEKAGLFPAQYFMPITGQEVPLDQASASVPFKIRLPTNLGSFVQLKLNTGTGSINIIYAAVKLPSDASLSDVLDQNGILLFEEPNEMTLENSALNIRAAINSTKIDPGSALQEVNINGYVGCAGGNVEHCVSWYTETTYYRLTANIKYPLQQLVAIAQSIPVN